MRFRAKNISSPPVEEFQGKETKEKNTEDEQYKHMHDVWDSPTDVAEGTADLR